MISARLVSNYYVYVQIQLSWSLVLHQPGFLGTGQMKVLSSKSKMFKAQNALSEMRKVKGLKTNQSAKNQQYFVRC
jgi:hypothetical protein